MNEEALINELVNDGFTVNETGDNKDDDDSVDDDKCIIDVAFVLTRSPWTETNNGNKFSLSLDEIIKIPNSTSIIERCIMFNYKIDPEWIFEACPILKDKDKIKNIYMFHGESMDSHY